MPTFVTYGNDQFRTSRERIAREAKDTGLFDNILVKSSLHEYPEIKKMEPYINMSRGAGYWLWKPIIIKNTLDQIPDNDILVYIDAGCSIHNTENAMIRWKEYFKMVELTDRPLVGFQMVYEERFYTSEAIFKHLNIPSDSSIRESGQYVGGIQIIRKCKISMEIVNKWYDTALTRPDLFTDILNNTDRHTRFIDNRHDQSVFSVIRKLYPENIWSLTDETYPVNNNMPIGASRIRG